MHKSNNAVVGILADAQGILANVVIGPDLLKALSKQQEWIGLTGLELKQAIHNNASLCMYMAEQSETHDAHALAGLVKNVDASFRFKALIGWIQMFTPIRFDGDGKIGVLKVGDKGYTPWQTQKAYDTPFWTIDELEEKVPTELSIASIRAMLEKTAKQVGEANDKGEIVSKAGKVTKTLKGDKLVIQDFLQRVLGVTPRPHLAAPAHEQPPVNPNMVLDVQPVQAQVG